MNQLERDLHHRIRDRLAQWAKDSIALYQMADLEEEGTSAMLSILIHFTAFMLTQVKVRPENAGALLTEVMTDIRKTDRRER